MQLLKAWKDCHIQCTLPTPEQVPRLVDTGVMAPTDFVDDAASDDDEEAGSEGEQQNNGQTGDQGGGNAGQARSEDGEVSS